MKKIIIVGIMGLGLIVLGMLLTKEVLADVEPILCGTQGNCQYKNPVILSKDVLDLQAQINILANKNLELERKLNSYQKPVVANTQPQTVISINDEGQTQRIDTLEKRMTLLEKTLQNVSGAISNTVDLIKKLLAKL